MRSREELLFFPEPSRKERLQQHPEHEHVPFLFLLSPENEKQQETHPKFFISMSVSHLDKGECCNKLGVERKAWDFCSGQKEGRKRKEKLFFVHVKGFISSVDICAIPMAHSGVESASNTG